MVEGSSGRSVSNSSSGRVAGVVAVVVQQQQQLTQSGRAATCKGTGRRCLRPGVHQWFFAVLGRHSSLGRPQECANNLEEARLVAVRPSARVVRGRSVAASASLNRCPLIAGSALDVSFVVVAEKAMYLR